MTMKRFSHIDKMGKAKMVDVSDKPVVKREAVASGFIKLKPLTISLIKRNAIQKGDCLAAAKIAGIMAAKKVGELIPLCHPLTLDFIDVNFEFKKGGIKITSIAKIQARTGVEMEALSAVSVSALTIYDMCKAVDKTMVIGDIKLIRKVKSRSGGG